MPSDTPLHKNSIDAFHINSARDLHRLTTGSRFPPKPSSSSSSSSTSSSSSATAAASSSSSSARPPLPSPQRPKSYSQSQLLQEKTKPCASSASSQATFNTPIQQQQHEQQQQQQHDKNSTASCNHNNPVCCHCGQVIIPAPVATFPLKDTPSICINDQWYVCTQRLPILNAQEIENFEEILNGIPVPEMIFGNNKVEIVMKEKNTDNIKFHIMFNPLDALKLVERNPEDLIQVSYADSWFKSRQLKHQGSENVSLEVYKPYDWTYTSKYKGTMIKADDGIRWLEDVDGTHAIPLDKLTSNNPIKFYDDMILYEDELGDNGISMLNIKVRVMSNCLLLLQRLFIRVDGVLVRIIDTRFYVDFEEYLIIREQKYMQDHYNTLVKKVAGPDPKKMMRDINWCSTKLPVVETTRDYIDLSKA